MTIVFALPLGYGSRIRCRRRKSRAGIVVLGSRCSQSSGRPPTARHAPANEWAIAVLAYSARRRRVVVLGGRGSSRGKQGSTARAGILFGFSASLCKPTVEILGDDGAERPHELGVVRVRDRGHRRVRRSADLPRARETWRRPWRPSPSSTRSSSIVIGTLLLEERLGEPTWHKLVAYVGLALALAGAGLISMATESAKEATMKGLRLSRLRPSSADAA